MKDLGFGLQVSGKTADGVVEAIEDPEREFVLGVQWHPEYSATTDDFSKKLFASFSESVEKNSLSKIK